MHWVTTAPASTSGEAVFGNTVISWTPIGTGSVIQVTVTMGGARIQQQTLTPLANQMAYDAASSTDWTKGQINVSFGPYGTSGQLYGVLTWQYQGGPGKYSGAIGTWSLSQDRAPRASALLVSAH